MSFFDGLERFANEVEKFFRGKPEALKLKSCKNCSFYKRGYCTQTSPPTRVLSEYYAQGCIYYTTSLPVVGVNIKNIWQDAENLDVTHGYTSYIWIPDETLQIKLLKLHIYAEKFRAYSKGAKAGGATVATSEPTGETLYVLEPSTLTPLCLFDTFDPEVSPPSSTVSASQVMVGECPDGHADCKIIDHSTVHPASALHIHEIGDIVGYWLGTDYVNTWVPTHDHKHTVTLFDHTHDLDFGIYEEAITGRTLSAKLYDPDDNLLKDFGVIITGEDDLILDLSDYFETLQYGMFRLELTASSRLRARLIYYELCAMSAVS